MLSSHEQIENQQLFSIEQYWEANFQYIEAKAHPAAVDKTSIHWPIIIYNGNTSVGWLSTHVAPRIITDGS